MSRSLFGEVLQDCLVVQCLGAMLARMSSTFLFITFFTLICCQLPFLPSLAEVSRMAQHIFLPFLSIFRVFSAISSPKSCLSIAPHLLCCCSSSLLRHFISLLLSLFRGAGLHLTVLLYPFCLLSLQDHYIF